MARNTKVERPLKKSEYTLKFGSRQAQQSWIDLVATHRNAMADAWDYLTKTPTQTSPRNYRLKGELSEVVRDGVAHERWQHKPTMQGTARIWFYVDANVVCLENIHTAHPNETK